MGPVGLTAGEWTTLGVSMDRERGAVAVTVSRDAGVFDGGTVTLPEAGLGSIRLGVVSTGGSGIAYLVDDVAVATQP